MSEHRSNIVYVYTVCRPVLICNVTSRKARRFALRHDPKYKLCPLIIITVGDPSGFKMLIKAADDTL